jgi:hypothetical protein
LTPLDAGSAALGELTADGATAAELAEYTRTQLLRSADSWQTPCARLALTLAS